MKTQNFCECLYATKTTRAFPAAHKYTLSVYRFFCSLFAQTIVLECVNSYSAVFSSIIFYSLVPRCEVFIPFVLLVEFSWTFCISPQTMEDSNSVFFVYCYSLGSKTRQTNQTHNFSFNSSTSRDCTQQFPTISMLRIWHTTNFFAGFSCDTFFSLRIRVFIWLPFFLHLFCSFNCLPCMSLLKVYGLHEIFGEQTQMDKKVKCLKGNCENAHNSPGTWMLFAFCSFFSRHFCRTCTMCVSR